MRHFGLASTIACVLALAVWHAWETRRLAQLVGESEVALRAARAAAEVDRQAAVAAGAEQGKFAGYVTRLEQDLDAALEYARQLGEAVTAEAEARERLAVQRAAAEAIVTVPPPVGVQRCLALLRECLRADGHGALRPLRARGLEAFALLDVEMLDLDQGTFGADLIVAARMTAVLDRGRGELALCFFDGLRRRQGVRTELPAGGLFVRLQPVEGRMWEARLPMLVRGEGQYPPDEQAQRSEVESLDPVTRMQWLERFDQLLADAGTDLELRVAGFHDLRDATFRSVRLCGYDSGRLLALAVDCAELAVEVDERAAVVSLLLKDGTLRRDGVQSTIHTDGYRMLLPNLTPLQASERMLGMVVRR